MFPFIYVPSFTGEALNYTHKTRGGPMSRKNIPLNDREKNTSKISFICSVITLLFLGFCFHQLDRVLITGPAEKAQAKEAAAEKAKKKSLNSVTTADIVAVGTICTPPN